MCPTAELLTARSPGAPPRPLRKHGRTGLWLVLAAALAGQALTVTRALAEPKGEGIVLRAARLIDGRSGAMLAPAMVRIDGGSATPWASNSWWMAAAPNSPRSLVSRSC